MPPFGLVLHGGAGDIRRDEITSSLDGKFRRALGDVLASGHALLAAGRPALDVVTETVARLEDCPLFNSGVGANLNADGECELDASVMDGRTLAAGAVAGVRTVRSPIRLARDVMERSRHVLLAAAGAEEFAAALGHERVENEFFQTPFRRAQWERVRKMERLHAAQSVAAEPVLLTSFSADDNYLMRELKFGPSTPSSSTWFATRSTRRATSPPPRPPAECSTSASGAWATRRSSAPAPTRTTSRAPSRARARGNTSSAWAWRRTWPHA